MTLSQIEESFKFPRQFLSFKDGLRRNMAHRTCIFNLHIVKQGINLVNQSGCPCLG